MRFGNLRRPFVVLMIGAILAGAGVYGYGHLTNNNTVTANGWATPQGSDTGTQCIRFSTPRSLASLDPTQVCREPDTLAKLLQSGDTGCADGNFPAGDSLSTTFDTGGVFFTYDASKAGAGQTIIDFNCGETNAPSTPNIGARTFLTSNFTIGIAANQTSTTIPVVSTVGFDDNSGGQFKIYVGTGGTEICSGMTSTSFTGCTLTGSSATKSFLADLTDVSQGSLVVNAAQSLTIKNAYPGNYISTQGAGVNDADSIIIDHAHVHHGWRNNGGSHDVAVQYSECGPNFMGGQEACDITSTDATNILWDHDTFHDMNESGCSTADGTRANFCHAECVYLKASGSITISNSRFWNCSTFSIFSEDFIGTLQNIVIRNNTFEECLLSAPSCPGSGSLATTYKSDSGDVFGPLTVEYNSFSNGQRFFGAGSPRGTFTGVVYRANSGVGATYDGQGLSEQGWCNLPGISTSYNVTTSAACSATDTNISSISTVFTDVSGHPYDFTPTGVALGHGDPANFPTTDINGVSRSGVIDAGAVQETQNSPISGASQAVCTPNPCTPGTAVSDSIGSKALGQVGWGNGTLGTSARKYSLYIPSGLNPSSTNKPAVILMARGAGCGSTEIPSEQTQSKMNPAADSHAFMVAYLAKSCSSANPCEPSHVPPGAGPAACSNQWNEPNIAFCTPVNACTQQTDEPYLTAVINDLVNNRSADPARIYFLGGSAGGALAGDVSCDSVNSFLLRGVAIISNSPRVAVSGGNPTGDPNCSNWTSNTNMFVLNIDGAGDTLASFGKGQGGSVPPYAGPCGATCGLSVYLNGDTSGHWFARHLGCSSTPTAATFGTPVAANLRNDYSGCSSHPGVGVSTYSITGGGHVWCMTASNTLTGCTPTSPEATNGFEMSQVILDWFAATTGF